MNDNVRALLRFELSDALRSRWLGFTLAVYAVVFGGFVWLGLRESTILGFTGLSRVVLNLGNAIVLIVPLVVLVATCQSIVRARSSGALELLLTQPCRRGDWLTGLVLSRLIVLVGPLVLLLAITTVVGLFQREGAAIVSASARTLFIAAALAWAFLGIGLYLSAIAKSAERAIVYALLAWAATAVLHDFALIGVLLKARLAPAVVFALAALNPAQAARLSLFSGIDPELSILGPVGFWMANTLGARASLVVGIAWPLVLGTVCALAAARRVRRMDVI